MPRPTALQVGARVTVSCASDAEATVTRVGYPYPDDVWVLVDGERAETIVQRCQVVEA